MSDPSGRRETRLFTTLGTAVFVDATTGELHHGSLDESPANAVFVTEPGTVRSGRIMQHSDGAYRPILCGPEGCRVLGDAPASESLAGTRLEIVPLERGLIAVKSDDLFLCAEPGGRLSLSRTLCSLWECFLAAEDWCTRGQAPGDAPGREAIATDRRAIADYIVDPAFRMKTRKTEAKKFLVFGYTQWSHGRAYYDLAKLLHDRGYVLDILDWSVPHSVEAFAHLLSYYDFVISSLDGIQVLVDAYHVPYERIIALSHAEMDLYILIDQKGKAVFDRFAAFGAVGFNIFTRAALLGLTRLPQVVPYGIDLDEFHAEIPERLATVGYASSMTQLTIYGVEIKRGELAEACAREAGLDFKIAGSTGDQISFHDMPAFYRSVDAVLMTSITEGDPYPVREAAAAGRLVIGTPVGHFPLRAYDGAGLIAPIEAEKFKAYTVAALRHYKENPAAYVEKCREIQAAARKLDWRYAISDWIELLESARNPAT
jgi:glycosyltransferase involved in cell wall biosynthesis